MNLSTQPKNKSISRVSLLVLAALAVSSTLTPSLAGTYTWIGTSATGTTTWSTPGNWAGGGVPGSGDTADFNAVVTGTTTDLGSGVTILNLLFDLTPSAMFIGSTPSQVLTLNDGGSITVNSTVANLETVTAGLVLGTDGAPSIYTLNDNGATGGVLKLGAISASAGSGTSNLLLTGSNAGAYNGNGMNRITGVISNGATGTVSVTKTGSGRWLLSGNNTFTGTLSFNTGTLLLTGTNVIGSSVPIIGNGGTLGGDQSAAGGLGNVNLSLGALTAATGESFVFVDRSATGTNAALTFTSYTRNAGATMSFSGAGGNIGTTIGTGADSVVIRLGASQAAGFLDQGTFFQGSNYAWYDTTNDTGGAVTKITSTSSIVGIRGIRYGTDAGAAAAITTAATSFTYGSNYYELTGTGSLSAITTGTISTVDFANTKNATETLVDGAVLTLNGILDSGANAITIANTGTLTSASLRVGNNAELVVDTVAAGDSVAVSVNIGGNGSNAFTKTGLGLVTLSGTDTYTGVTSVDAGTLEFGGRTSLYNGTTSSWNGTNIIVNNGATLRIDTGSASFTGTDVATIGGTGGATFAVGSTYQAYITGSSNTVAVTGSLTGNYNFSLADAGNNGADELVLSGVNTYAGTTTSSGGILLFAAPSALYNGNTAQWTTSNLINSAKMGVKVGGTTGFTSAQVDTLLAYVDNASTGTVGIKMGSGDTFVFDTSLGAFTYASNIGGAENLQILAGAHGVNPSASSALTLSGQSTYTAGTVVGALGALGVNGGYGAALIFGSSSVVSGNTIVSGPIGTGTLTNNGELSNSIIIGDNGSNVVIENASSWGANGLQNDDVKFVTQGSGGSLTFDNATGSVMSVSNQSYQPNWTIQDNLIINQNMVGSANIIFAGSSSGSLTLAGQNTLSYTFTTLPSLFIGSSSTISGGVLVSGPLGPNAISFPSMNIDDNGTAQTIANNIVIGTSSSGANLTFNSTGTGTGGSLTFSGAGTTYGSVFSMPGNAELIANNNTTIADNITPLMTTGGGLKNLFLLGSGNGTITGQISDTAATQTLAASAAFTSGTTSITVPNAQYLFSTGLAITGTGIPAGDTIKSVSGNVVTLNTATTGTGTSGESVTLSGGAGGQTYVTEEGTGSWTLGAANTYSGGTQVYSGTLVLTNTAGSATGTGPTAVYGGAVLAGTGTSSGNGLMIGDSSGVNAVVLVGQTPGATAAANLIGQMTLNSSTTATITATTMAFNIDATTPGNGNKLNVGATKVDFSLGSVTLALNLQGNAIIASNTPYLLIIGNTGTSLATTQYLGLTLTGPSTAYQDGTMTQIANSMNGGTGDLALSMSGQAASFYGANSYLFLYQGSAGEDDIGVEFVPEPQTWAMMLGGFGILLFWQRRKNRLS